MSKVKMSKKTNVTNVESKNVESKNVDRKNIENWGGYFWRKFKKQVGKFESNVYYWKEGMKDKRKDNDILIYRPQIMFFLDNHNFFVTTKDKPFRRSDL